MNVGLQTGNPPNIAKRVSGIMRMKLLEMLACTKCFGGLSCVAEETLAQGEVESGRLECGHCGTCYPIIAGVPRFVDHDNYASSFGYQWNRFKAEQIDSLNGIHLSAKRFY